MNNQDKLDEGYPDSETFEIAQNQIEDETVERMKFKPKVAQITNNNIIHNGVQKRSVKNPKRRQTDLQDSFDC